MRRLLRWFFNIVAAGSVLLCVAACVLWARSYRAGHLASWNRPRGALQLGASRGDLWVYRATEPMARWYHHPAFEVESYPDAPGARQWGYGPPFLPFRFNGAGFAYGSGPYATVAGRTAVVVIVPCWAAALAALLPALLWLHLRLRNRRRWARSRAGLCRSCGYDLRATPEGPAAGGALLGRCPECGAATGPGGAG